MQENVPHLHVSLSELQKEFISGYNSLEILTKLKHDC
jgi:hypothetical protein